MQKKTVTYSTERGNGINKRHLDRKLGCNEPVQGIIRILLPIIRKSFFLNYIKDEKKIAQPAIVAGSPVNKMTCIIRQLSKK